MANPPHPRETARLERMEASGCATTGFNATDKLKSAERTRRGFGAHGAGVPTAGLDQRGLLDALPSGLLLGQGTPKNSRHKRGRRFIDEVMNHPSLLRTSMASRKLTCRRPAQHCKRML